MIAVFFSQARMRLETCHLSHDAEMRDLYRESRETRRYGFEEKSLQVIKSLVDDAERRIDKAAVSFPIDQTLDQQPLAATGDDLLLCVGLSPLSLSLSLLLLPCSLCVSLCGFLFLLLLLFVSFAAAPSSRER